MRTFFRNLVVAALPLLFGAGAGFGFALSQQSCGKLVGAIFASKCHGRQLEYQILFQTAGAAAGTLIAAVVGTWVEHRRRRVVQRPDLTGGPS